MKNLATLYPTLLLALLAGCAQTPPPKADTREADTQAIRSIETAWVQAWAAKDTNKIMSYYADDAMFLIANMPPAMGRDAIAKMVAEFAADPALSITWTPEKIEVSGDLAYSQGPYTGTMTDPDRKKPVTEKGHYLEVFKRQADGSWKVVADVSSPDAAPTPVAAK